MNIKSIQLTADKKRFTTSQNKRRPAATDAQPSDGLGTLENLAMAQSDLWCNFRTDRFSLLHRLISVNPFSGPPTTKRYWLLYFATIAITYLVPFYYALLCRAPLVKTQPGIVLPFFWDFNVAVMAMVSTPVLFLLLYREPRLLRKVLCDLTTNKVIPLNPELVNNFVDTWENRYGLWNLVASAIGLSLAFAVVFFITWPVTMALHGKSWQTIGAAAGHPNAAGWSFFILQVGVFYFLLGFYAVREIAAYYLLRDVVKAFPPNIHPLDPDQVGGLRGISELALHFQIPVAVIGINIGSMFGVMRIIDLKFFGVYGIASLTAYLLIAPLAFSGPLFPFRRSMVAAKRAYSLRVSRAIRAELDRVLVQLEAGSGQDADFERVQKLQSLSETIASFPEWPFDIKTFKRFLMVFLSPGATALVSWVFQRLVGE